MRKTDMDRREFIGRAAALAGPAFARTSRATEGNPIAFNTANLVGRVTGYRYSLSNWMDQHKKTIAATDAAAWRSICGEIASAGFKACGKFVRHVHVKDVKRVGAHETCPLGEGVAKVADCLQALRASGYAGAYSWEDEPEDRDPFDAAARNLLWIRRHVS